MSALLLREARILLTCDDADTISRDSDVLVSGGVITAVGPSLQAPPDAEIVDCSSSLVMPGLVNLHTHSPMSLLRGFAEGVDLDGFLARVWAAEARVMNPQTVELGARLAALEGLRAGVTTALDMYLFPADAHRGAVAVGQRHVAGPVFFEGTGPDGLTWAQRLDEATRWASVLAEIGGPHVPTALMPHGVYTNSPAHLREISDLAADFELVTVHVSETKAETADAVSRFGGTPVEILRQAGLLGLPGEGPFQVVLAHGIHLKGEDWPTIAAYDATVAHCPGSNLKLAAGAMNWEKTRAAGVRLGLGTDGCASSNDLDLWQTMRTAALLARLTSRRPTAGAPTAVLRAATIDAARALGLGEQIGSIEVGKRADLLVLDLDQPHLTPVHDVPALLVFAAGRGDVTDVFVDGERVIADRQSTRVDQTRLLAECRSAAASIG